MPDLRYNYCMAKGDSSNTGYMTGGDIGSVDALVFSFDITTLSFGTISPMNSPRFKHGCHVDDATQKLIVAGGKDANYGHNNLVEILDVRHLELSPGLTRCQLCFGRLCTG